MQSISLLRSQAYIWLTRFAVLNCIAFSDSHCSSVSAQFRQRSVQRISLLRSQAYIRLARFAVPFSKPAEAGENGLGTFSPAPRVRSESIRSDKHKKTGIKPVFCAWRRARDSNPTFAMAGIVENTGLQRLVKMSVFKSVFKKSPAGLCVLFIQNA